MRNGMKFRHELKYLVNPGDAELIRERLRVLLRPDDHAENGQYSIRSLYFDDYWNTAYQDKLCGFPERRKYRVRIYNGSRNLIRLECKIKNASYICKTGASLSEEEMDRLWRGDYGFLLKREEPLCREMYYQCVSRVLRPRVYVDYEREPYVLDAGDVRITFDRDVRGAGPGWDIFSPNLAFHHVLEPGKLVMEVKFTEFLPRVVQQALPSRAQEFGAVSKYTLCCDKIHYLTAKTAD